MSSPPIPRYSVIIPAYDEERLLPTTLAALARAMGSVEAAGEVVVCDNNSSDRTAEIATAAGARVVFESVNQISRARNTGARAARGEWLIFLDADSEISSGLLEDALRALGSGRVAGGGSTISLGGGIPTTMARAAALWNRISRRHRLAAGSFVFVLRTAFDAVGGFSEQVYASEEIWLSRAIGKWARERDLEFVILEAHPLTTSPRKAEWYSTTRLLVMGLPLILFPFLVRSRTFCRLWYRRPSS